MPFKKGEPRPAKAGRRKGTPNKVTVEIKQRARALLESPDYMDTLPARILTCPHLETLLYHYAYGKPKQEIDLLHDFSDELEIRIHQG